MRAWLEQRQAGKVPNYTVVKAVAEQATEQAHSLLSDVCSATEAETIVKQLCQQCERPHDGLSLSGLGPGSVGHCWPAAPRPAR